MQTETGESNGCGPTDGQRRERPGGRDGGVLRERGGPGALIGCGQRGAGPGGMGCRGGLGVGPCAAPPGPTLPPRCAGASRTLAGLLGSTWEGSPGEGPGPRGLRPGLPPLLSARPGLPGPGEGGRFWPVPPPHAPPRGPDSGVRGRTGDARPVYPPGAASAPTGGAARAGEGSPPRPATCPGRSALGRKTPSPPRWYPRVQAPSTLGLTSPGLQCLIPQTYQSRLSPPPSLPQGVCCLVLVALSLWPDIAAAPGPPPGPPRASADPRAELDSAVLLSRSLLADTRQLAAQLRDKFPADGDHNLDSLPTLAMSAGALGALQLPGVLTRLRADLFSYLRHVQWLRRVGGPSLKTLEPELGGLQARLDRLLRRLQLLMSRLALPQAPPEPPAPPLAPPASAWGGIRAAHAILGGLHLTLDWAVRGLLLLKTRL
ncbi:interleukin-11 [Rhinolophus sinicus]|uniref:interleukin-11 n=1 Tax=Rhinolophus sinicus TaxID=89399 RepID=UPI003D7996A4